jgi:hypothetical protein
MAEGALKIKEAVYLWAEAMSDTTRSDVDPYKSAVSRVRP